LASAYLLVSHGSRDPRPQIAVEELVQQLSLWLRQFSPINSPGLIGRAQLELGAKPLHLQIVDFARNCQERGIGRVVIFPLFLLPGIHVMEDIPSEVAIANRELDDLVELVIAPFLGSCPDLANLFTQHCLQLPDRTTIIAHGSRRKGGNHPVEQLAASLGFEMAYWSIEPSLTDRVTDLVARGATEIAIIPYFLFSGGITDAIANLVAKLREQFPQVQLILGAPIGNSPELVVTIGKMLISLDSNI
jgi:sirohydrochlorin cobaltochelatase